MDIAQHSGTVDKPDLVDPIDGRSLLPLLLDKDADDPDEAIGEYMGEGAIAPILMIKRGNYKFIYSTHDPLQLYDLNEDPFEVSNLAAQEEFQGLVERFKMEVSERWSPKELREDVINDQRKRRLLFNALKSGNFQPWDYQPGRDSTQQYMRNHLDLNDLERVSRFPNPNKE